MPRDRPTIVSRDQLLAAGVTRSALEARLRAGRWQRVLPRVYATHSGQVTAVELLEAALLYAGPHAALSHGTAAALHGMPFTAKTVHVTLPNDRRVGDQPGLTIHYSRRWPHGPDPPARAYVYDSPTNDPRSRDRSTDNRGRGSRHRRRRGLEAHHE